MKTAHEGVPVAALPSSQGSWGLSNLAQATSQVSPPTVTAPGPAPASNGGYRPPSTRANARPEAAAGL